MSTIAIALFTVLIPVVSVEIYFTGTAVDQSVRPLSVVEIPKLNYWFEN